VVGPAFSTEPFGEAVAGKLQPGQTVIVSPGSCGGALAFKRSAGLKLEDDSIRIAETHTLHYARRIHWESVTKRRNNSESLNSDKNAESFCTGEKRGRD
jgi:hypothetical protein